MIKAIKGFTLGLAITYHLAIASLGIGEWDIFVCYIKQNQLIVTGIFVSCMLYTCSTKYLYDKSFSVRLPALLFSMFTLLGNTFRNGQGFDQFSLTSISGGFLIIAVGIGYIVAFSQAIILFWRTLEKWGGREERVISCVSEYVFEKKPLVKTMIIILLCWSPYYIGNYPGTVTFDGYYQIDQFFGIHEMTAHHPIIPTLIMGVCMKIGRYLLNDNFGIFLYTLLNGTVLSFAFSSTIALMKRLGTPIRFRYVALGFYALYTEWPSFAHCVIKDTLYTAFVVLYCVQLVYILFLDSKNSNGRNIALIVSAIVICLYRKNGIYLTILTTLYALIFARGIPRVKLVVAMSLIVPVISMSCVNHITDKTGIPRGGAQEALSIPFQQTARYIQNHEDEISQEEIKIIDSVLDYETVKNNYNPIVSDPIKGTYKLGERNHLRPYLRLWLKQFLKHPLTYFAATINNSYGYYCLEVPFIGIADEYNITSHSGVNTGDFEIYFASPFRETLGKGLEKLRYLLEGVPIVNLLYSGGFYTWVLICLVCKLIEIRRKPSITILFPAITTVLICIASPVNAYHSYLLPTIATLPLAISIVLYDMNISIRLKNNTRGGRL